jgi:hypothetical protein
MAVPAGAVTVRHIDVTVAESGDAYIVADYSLNWIEQVVVYPAALSLLSLDTGKHTVIHSVSPDQARLTMQHFVKVQHTNNSTIYSTKAFSAVDAQRELNQLWFGGLVTLDLTSGSLTIRFPDGDTVENTDLTTIPAFVHTTTAP